MNFNPPTVADAAANQYLQDVTNGNAGANGDENIGKSAKRFKASLDIHFQRGNVAISEAELGQQATCVVEQALRAIPGAVAGDHAPRWAVQMETRINNNVNKNINNLRDDMAKMETRINEKINNLRDDMTNKINKLRNDMIVQFDNVHARYLNGFVAEEEDPVAVITNSAGDVPDKFPPEFADFQFLTPEEVTVLSNFYGLVPLVDDPTARKVRLRRYLGIRTA